MKGFPLKRSIFYHTPGILSSASFVLLNSLRFPPGNSSPPDSDPSGPGAVPQAQEEILPRLESLVKSTFDRVSVGQSKSDSLSPPGIAVPLGPSDSKSHKLLLKTLWPGWPRSQALPSPPGTRRDSTTVLKSCQICFLTRFPLGRCAQPPWPVSPRHKNIVYYQKRPLSNRVFGRHLPAPLHLLPPL